MTKDSGSGFFTGLIIGAIIGAAIGFLYAPQPGAETRRAVKEKAATAREAASRAASRVKDKLQVIHEEPENE